MIPGFNDEQKNFLALAEFLTSLEYIPKVELLPYNALAGSKYPRMGMTYYPGILKETDGNSPDMLCTILTDKGIHAKVVR